MEHESTGLLRFASMDNSAGILRFASGVCGLGRVTWRPAVSA
jgi:hypothetical protein